MSAGDTLYVWQSLEDGAWSQIHAKVPLADGTETQGLLSSREIRVAKWMQQIAEHHGQMHNQEIRLARFVYDGEVSVGA